MKAGETKGLQGAERGRDGETPVIPGEAKPGTGEKVAAVLSPGTFFLAGFAGTPRFSRQDGDYPVIATEPSQRRPPLLGKTPEKPFRAR